MYVLIITLKFIIKLLKSNHKTINLVFNYSIMINKQFLKYKTLNVDDSF